MHAKRKAPGVKIPFGRVLTRSNTDSPRLPQRMKQSATTHRFQRCAEPSNLEMAFHPEPGGAPLSDRPCRRCPTPLRSALDPGSPLLLPCTATLAATLGSSGQSDTNERWGRLGEYARNITKAGDTNGFTLSLGVAKKSTAKLDDANSRFQITHPENSRLVRKSTDRFVQVHLESTVVPSRSQDFAVANVEQIGCIIRG